MSDISLNANVYQVSKRYYSIINQFLSDANVSTKDISETQKKPVLELFRNLLNAQSNEPQIHMIAIIIDRALRSRNKKLHDVANNIASNLSESQPPSEETITTLRDISRALDNERVSAMTRMKGMKR